jgi:hypothetical protein
MRDICSCISLLEMHEGSHETGFRGVVEDAVMYRAEAYQASRMVAIQLNIPVDQALVRIRAYAFSTGQDLVAVAAQIVARSLRLCDDKQEPRDDF